VASPQDNEFWILGITWVSVVIVGAIPWDRVLATGRGRPLPATVEALVGPSRLQIAADAIPNVGRSVTLTAGGNEATGLVVRRTLRASDFLGEIAVIDGDAELLARGPSVTLTEVESGPTVGVVEARSSDSELEFTSAKDLSIGEAIEVRDGAGGGILYQVEAASIEDAQAPGGGRNLVVRVKASQIGVLDPATARIQDTRWAPPLTGVVSKVTEEPAIPVPEGWLKLGSVIGSAIPVFLDLDAAFQGHLAVLGMTRMGKTTLCLRLANGVSASRRVVILDQTGEYVAKHGLPVADPAGMWDPGLKVHEKPAGPSGPEFALGFFKDAVDVASAEYAKGDPELRAVFIEEAHQFIPEPAMLGFGDVRTAAIDLGQLVMQIRKYGLATVLVSQRTAVVAKSALSQCENLIVFKSVDQTGLDYVEAIGGSVVRSIVPRLRQGQALVCGPAMSSERPVAVQIDQ
jgi:hypothetical protein